MSAARRIVLVLAGLAMLLAGAAYWLAGTDAGTRWILGRAKPYLPRQLLIGDAQGSFLRGLRVTSLTWSDEALRITVQDLYLDVKLLPLLFRHVAVNELHAAAFDIAIGSAGEADRAKRDPGLPRIDLPIGLSIAAAKLENVTVQIGSIRRQADNAQISGSLFGSDLTIDNFSFDGPVLDIDVDGRVRMAGTWPGRARAAWRWTEAGVPELAGTLRLQGDTQRYDWQHALTAPVSVATSGSVSFESGVLRADLMNEWQALDLTIGARRLQSSNGRLRLQGTLDAFAVALDATAKLDEFPETQLELAGNADLKSIRISQLRAVNELGDLSGSGTASWAPEQAIDFGFSLAGVDPARLADSVSGTLGFDGHVTGSFGAGAPRINLRIERMAGDINGHALSGRASLSLANNTLSVADGLVEAGSNRLTVSGTVGDSISLGANLDLDEVAEFLPDASGALRGRLDLSGSRARPDARIELSGTSLRYGEYALDRFTAHASVSQTERSSVELEFRQFSAGRISLDSARIALTGRIDDHDIELTLNGYGSELATEVTGRLAEERWQARIGSLVLVNEEFGRWSSPEPAEVTVSADEVTLSGTCLSGATLPGRACLSGRAHRDGSSALDFSLLGLPLAAIPADLPGDVSLGGVVDAHAQLETMDRRMSGQAGIELRQATVDAIYDGESVSAAFSTAAAEATLVDNRVDAALRLELDGGAGAGSMRLLVQDLADRRSAIAGEGEVSISDVSLFVAFLPGIADPRGRIEGGMTISGTVAEPEFRGEVILTDGAFAVRQAGIEIVDIEARLSQRDAGRLQLSGRASSGDGHLSIEGDTQLGGAGGFRSSIVLSGEDFELMRLPEWQVAASPSITVVFDERATTISGNLGIPAASITVKDIPASAESPSRDAIVHRAEGAQSYSGRRIHIDLTTTLGDDVNFAGFGLTAGLDGSVRLRGGSHEPYIGAGTLELTDGRYKAYGQELEIERGELLFNGPLDDPQLDIRAVRHADDVIAGINLTGTPSQLRSEVFSEPAMSDSEALSYLLTGRSLASASSAAEGDVLNNAAFALGMTGAGRIASQVQSELGLETLTVEGGSDSGRIVAGKRFGNRLLVEYGYGIVDKLGTLLLRYQLTERIILESRTGTVSVFDVVYSVKKP